MRPIQSYSAKKVLTVLGMLVLAAIVMSRPAQAQNDKFRVLHTFHGRNGAFPGGSLVRDAAGNFYGTTIFGGKGCTYLTVGCGTAFKLDKSGKQVWVHTFSGSNGSTPYAGLLLEKEGDHLYGTTYQGGDTQCDTNGCGTVFKLDKDGRESLLYAFKGHPGDGSGPEALLIEDSEGNLYGTTTMGGESDLGTVFRVGVARKETILYNFKGPVGGGGDGAYPVAGVISDAAGNLYGGTGAGGGGGKGVVFEVEKSGNETLLYSFSGGLDGAGPGEVLLMDLTGNLYGTTQDGGYAVCGYHCGSVYELSPQGGWKETTLYTFCSLSNCEDGEEPMRGPLVRDKHGNLYGTTNVGGKYTCTTNGLGCGVVFKLNSSGKETVIYNFTGGADGAFPFSGLTLDSAGNLYGTATQGGDLKCAQGNGQGCGTVFEITLSKSTPTARRKLVQPALSAQN